MTIHDRVAVLAIDNPPVNGLGFAVRRMLVEGVDRANADPAVEAIVVTGSGKFFSAGADVREFGTPRSSAEPTLTTVIGIVEASVSTLMITTTHRWRMACRSDHAYPRSSHA